MRASIRQLKIRESGCLHEKWGGKIHRGTQVNQKLAMIWLQDALFIDERSVQWGSTKPMNSITSFQKPTSPVGRHLFARPATALYLYIFCHSINISIHIKSAPLPLWFYFFQKWTCFHKVHTTAAFFCSTPQSELHSMVLRKLCIANCTWLQGSCH